MRKRRYGNHYESCLFGMVLGKEGGANFFSHKRLSEEGGFSFPSFNQEKSKEQPGGESRDYQRYKGLKCEERKNH